MTITHNDFENTARFLAQANGLDVELFDQGFEVGSIEASQKVDIPIVELVDKHIVSGQPATNNGNEVDIHRDTSYLVGYTSGALATRNAMEGN
jgi:hypothetical protein